jgi:tetratricopeptide (TPR) repeat protein
VTLFLVRIDRLDEAIAMGNYLLLRDPACGVCIGNLAYAYETAGRHQESARVLEEFLSWHAPTGGSYAQIGTSWLLAGFPDRALAAFEMESEDGNREMGTIMALHDLGRMDEFETRFASLRNDAEGGRDAEGIAQIYAWIGSNDEAFEWLDKMVAFGGSEMLAQIGGDLYAKIEPDPRWSALREKYGYHDKPIEPVEAIEFRYTLPTGVSND